MLKNVSASESANLHRMFFQFNGRQFEVTSYNSGRTEWYELDDATGIFMYVGTVSDGCAKAAREACSLSEPDFISEMATHLALAFWKEWDFAF